MTRTEKTETSASIGSNGKRRPRDIAPEQLLGHRLLHRIGRGRDVIVLGGHTAERSEAMLAAAVARVEAGESGVQALIIVPAASEVERIAARSGNGPARIVPLGPAESPREEAHAVSSGPAIVVTTPERLIDHIRRDNADVSRTAVCIVEPPDDATIGQFSADLHFIFTKFDRPPVTILFVASESQSVGEIEELMRYPATLRLRTPAKGVTRPIEAAQEQETMADTKLPFDEDSAARQLRDIVAKIHEEESPAEMVAYKRFIKRHVNIFNRAYFMAYLFKKLMGGGDLQTESSTSARTSIFVSAGRNRRIHARDLVTLFTSADGVTRDDIGQIKVLDNYSFVEVESSKAQHAIEELNGKELRGRKLTVNYARRK